MISTCYVTNYSSPTHHYSHLNSRRMVWKATSQYRQKLAEAPSDAKMKSVAVALGDEKGIDEEGGTFQMTEVKFPSKTDEFESMKLFHRRGGPLAATLSGREKLVREGKETYEDGRSLHVSVVS